MNRSLLSLGLAIAGSALAVSTAQAQGRVAFAHAGRTSAPLTRGGGGTRVALRGGRRFFAGPGYFPYFYPAYGYDQGYSEAPPDQIIEQDAEPAPPAPARVPADALMIELQGDRWVRVTNNGETQVGGDSAQPPRQHDAKLQSSALATDRRAEMSEPSAELPHAVLVFRDGHQEEIGKYVISGATIYAGADYWSGGSWTRKVQLAELNVPATLKLNQDRGARFTLPSSADEVMIRP